MSIVAMVISQFCLKVSVINVPSKINDSVNIPQRKFSTILAVQLRFRRRINKQMPIATKIFAPATPSR